MPEAALLSAPLLLYRISTYASLEGMGGLHAAARWNSRGHSVCYLADSVTSAMLEVLVHLQVDEDDVPDHMKLLTVSVPLSVNSTVIEPPPNGSWREDQEATRRLGDEWLLGKQTAIAKVPSALAPSTWNYLLNPQHSAAPLIRIVEVASILFDRRLLFRRESKQPDPANHPDQAAIGFTSAADAIRFCPSKARLQTSCPRTHSTIDRTAIPVGPFGSHGLVSSFHAQPAISR